jgi:hypothetical protein
MTSVGLNESSHHSRTHGRGGRDDQGRIRLNISFAAADDMYGFKTTLQKDSSGTTPALVGLFTNGVASTIAARHLGFDAYYLLPGIGKAIIASQFGRYSSAADSASNDLSESFVSAGPLFANLSADVDLTNSHCYFKGAVAYLVIPQVKLRGYGAYNDATTGNIAIDGINNKYSFGGDLVLPVGKSEMQAGVVYGDQANLQFPILRKANFRGR